MVKKEIGRCIVVYRDVFDKKTLDEYLDFIKYSETNHTRYINPSKEDVEKYGIGGPEAYINGKLLSKPGWMNWEGNKMKTYFADPPNIEPYISDNGFEKNFFVNVKNTIREIFIDYLEDHKDCKTFAPYVNNFDLSAKEWVYEAINIYKHNSCQEPGQNLGYHIDAPPNSVSTNASDKRTLAVNLYMTDDYDDGRISFLHGNSINEINSIENLGIVYYKPKAGDMVVYPAGMPVAHAVQKPVGADRYFINAFLEWKYDGSMGEELLKYIDPDIHSKLGSMVHSVDEKNIKYIEGKDLFDE